jgi:hypothetical protein
MIKIQDVSEIDQHSLRMRSHTMNSIEVSIRTEDR